MAIYSVLVVDDNDGIRAAIRLVLEDSGLDIYEAANGCAGLDMIRAATTPLVVILDLMMPCMTGVELLHTVGGDADLAARHAFVICSAAHAFPLEALARYLPSGRLCLVPKPFHVDALIAAVQRAGMSLEI